MSLAAGTQFGSFELIDKIGSGGMGEVWRARDSSLNRDVAVKLLPADFSADTDRLSRFRREAQILASLNHPNIATIHGLESVDGQTVIVMELVDGPTLADRIAEGPIAFDEALGIAYQIIAALEAAHSRQIVHRDLKPANIKLRPDGFVKVLDFGIAKPLDAEAISGGSPIAATPAVTQTGVILGTAAYMSPEQARGRFVDERTDVWAFGCLLFEMLTGQPAFGGEDVMATLARVIDRDTDLSSMPGTIVPAVRHTIRLCLEKDPAKRIADIRDVRLALDGRFESLDPERAAPPGPPPSLARRLLPVTGAAAVSALIVVLVAWSRWPEPPVRAVERIRDTIIVNQPMEYARPGIFGLSRDGSTLAYIAGEGEGIYLRTPDAGYQLVAGTEEAVPPFILSPDGQSMAFMSLYGDLLRVDIGGGAPKTLVPAESFTGINGGTWGSDGTIVYADGSGNILRVEADGGDPEMLIQAAGDENFQSPQLLPDGKTLLVSHRSISTNWDEAEIIAYPLDTRIPVPLISGGSDARYLSTGHIVYALGDALYAAAFDPATLHVGQRGEILRGVTRHAAIGTADFGFADDGTLAYLSRVGQPARRVSWVTGNGDGTATVTPIEGLDPEAYIYAQLSSDDSFAALNYWDNDDRRRVSVLDFERRRIDPLSEERVSATAILSPDDRVAYSTNISESGAELQMGAILLADPQGLRGTQEITRFNPGTWLVPSHFASDDTVLFAHSAGAPRSIWVVPLGDDGAERRQITDPGDVEMDATLSPDGSMLAYQVYESGRYEVYVRPWLNGEPGRRVKVSQGGGFLPVWSRGEGEPVLYFITARSSGSRFVTMMRATITVTENNIVRPDAPTELFSVNAFAMDSLFRSPYDVALDGRFLMLTPVAEEDDIAATSEIVIVRNWDKELKENVPAGN